MKLPRSFFNRVSIFGASLAASTIVVVGAYLIWTLILGYQGENPYSGLIFLILLPAILVLGLILIPVGMLLTRRREVKAGSGGEAPLVSFDLAEPSHRNALYIFVTGTLIFLVLSAIGGYHAFELTEGNAFCGGLCHEVMEPEWLASQHSPHARVKCTSCHVGSGPTWYMRAKLTGLHQVYAVTFDKYPRPIPSPPERMRPAQDTCWECHWPEKFKGDHLRVFKYYIPDEENSPWPIEMMIKVGGRAPLTGKASGAHWHYIGKNEVYYYARDRERQDIPWVRFIDRETGIVKDFIREEEGFNPEEIPEEEIRRMDCMDCHNRPAHRFRSPSAAINEAIEFEAIDPSLPSFKELGMEILIDDYETKDEALQRIEERVREYYEEDYPEIYYEKRGAVERAIQALQEIYKRNFFPKMDVSWETYPENIGHLDSPGCFRCHDDKLVTADGEKIPMKCSQCHIIVAQGPGLERPPVLPEEGLEFLHPEDVDKEEWEEGICWDCHTGEYAGF